MIATGGLLRITARRQDSLKPKPHKAHKRKKSKHKRRTEVVVVRGKLKLVSVSGLVAALGVLVLLVGMAMAALGYWPRDGLFLSAGTHEASTRTSTPAAGTQEPEGPSPPEGDGGRSPAGVNATSQQGPGLLTALLNRYLYSDRLKVWGPLVMGVGIFLFICANAVLHENRDKKTKVINLRDIYSTVIDLHQPGSSNRLHGLVNYVQSKSLEPRSRCYPAFLLGRGEGKGGGAGGGEEQPEQEGGGGGGVFSVDQYEPSAPSASVFSSPPPAAWRRHSARGGGQGGGRGGGGLHQQGGVASCPPACVRSSLTSCSLSSLQVEALLLSSPSASAYRRCSLPAVTAARRSHRQSCDPAEATSPHLEGGSTSR